MNYSLLIQSHPNIRYRVSLQKLAKLELQCILSSFGFDITSVQMRENGTETFLFFEAPENMSAPLYRALSRHSGSALLSVQEGDCLRPLTRKQDYHFSNEMPYVLKYKGKTNPDFTAMMLHCALAASSFFESEEKLRVLDPMCGKGTSLFCALCEGYDALGVDVNQKEIDEGIAFAKSFFQYHKQKYHVVNNSHTLCMKKAVRSVDFCIGSENSHQLEWLYADCASIPSIIKRSSCHLAICDFPYGVQHIPKAGEKISNLSSLVKVCAKSSAFTLKPGGAAAFAFNVNTLTRKEIESAFFDCGLNPLQSAPWNDYSHWVEQAITRDIVIAVKK